MKEVERISISSVAFTFEKDAVSILNRYLECLKKYYHNTLGNNEIMSDIEERIAELLIEAGGRERVVNRDDVEKIISILGTPEDLGDVCGGDSNDKKCRTDAKQEYNDTARPGSAGKKVLYRDIQNKVLGGVCSGLGKYLNIDVVWVRVIFIILLLFGNINIVLSFSLSGTLFLAYIILWIAIPPAKTVAQRCAMDGIDPGLDGIKQSYGNYADKRDSAGCSFIGGVCRVILFVIGISFLFFGIVAMIIFVVLFGIDIVSGINALSIPDYLELGTGYSLLLKIVLVGVIFLPCIGLLYLGSKICFKIKSPKWHPGLIIFILWVVCLVLSVVLGVFGAKDYLHNSRMEFKTEFNKNYDTLYVKYARPNFGDGGKMYLDTWYKKSKLYYVEKGDDGARVAYYPTLRVIDNDDTSKAEAKLYINSAKGISLMDAFSNSQNGTGLSRNYFEIKDSLITIYPTIVSKSNKFDGKFSKINLYIPRTTVVILKEPKEYEYNKR